MYIISPQYIGYATPNYDSVGVNVIEHTFHVKKVPTPF